LSSVTYAKLGIITYKMHWALATRVGPIVDKAKDEASLQLLLFLLLLYTFSIWLKRMTRGGGEGGEWAIVWLLTGQVCNLWLVWAIVSRPK